MGKYVVPCMSCLWHASREAGHAHMITPRSQLLTHTDDCSCSFLASDHEGNGPGWNLHRQFCVRAKRRQSTALQERVPGLAAFLRVRTRSAFGWTKFLLRRRNWVVSTLANAQIVLVRDSLSSDCSQSSEPHDQCGFLGVENLALNP